MDQTEQARYVVAWMISGGSRRAGTRSRPAPERDPAAGPHHRLRSLAGRLSFAWRAQAVASPCAGC